MAVTARDVEYMKLALAQAKKSPPAPTNFCVGAVLVSPSTTPDPVLATGYTLELPGNTHAEENCLQKIAERFNVTQDQIGSVLPDDTVLYTTMEPCNKRLSGKAPCVARVLACKDQNGNQRIRKVYLGVFEPEKFVGTNLGRAALTDAGIEVVHVPGLEKETLQVAQAGHEK